MIAVELVDVVTSGRLAGPELDAIDRAVYLAARRGGDVADDGRGCVTGKLRHESEIAARRFARTIHWHGRPVSSRVYPCEQCGGWHLTTTRRWRAA